MRKERRVAELDNFNEHEGECSCGCGKRVAGTLMLRLQSFVNILEAEEGSRVGCIITSGARCDKTQRAAYEIIWKRQGLTNLEIECMATPESYHLGSRRIDTGVKDDAYAVDVKFFVIRENSKVYLRRAYVAKKAIDSKLFGGVGYKSYEGDGSPFIHLDLGPVRSW